MAEWDEAPEWRRAEAKQFTPEERSNLRSWGFDVLEPPASVSAFQEPRSALCLKCPEQSVAGSNYCPKHRPRKHGGCTGASHDFACTFSHEPRGLCGDRAPSLGPGLAFQITDQNRRTLQITDQNQRAQFSLNGVDWLDGRWRTLSGGPA